MREEVVFRQDTRGTGVDVVHDDARAQADAPWRRRVLAPGVNDDLVPESRQPSRERGDVDVLAARVYSPDRGQRTCMLGHHRDLQT
jgi:hypothetical protein